MNNKLELNNTIMKYKKYIDIELFTGFEISWDGSSTGCGGSLTSPEGDIISPNYPQV